MSDLNPIIPKGATIIAECGGYAVLEIDLDDLGTCYILKGLSTTDYLFTKQEWDCFAKFVAYADLKIRAVVE